MAKMVIGIGLFMANMIVQALLRHPLPAAATDHYHLPGDQRCLTGTRWHPGIEAGSTA